LITDTHAHLFYPEIFSDLDSILHRAKDSGIERIIVPAVDLETSKSIISMSEKYDMIYCAVGIHPCDVNKSEIKDIDAIEKLLDHEKVVAIGETGLDYYWDKSNIERQKTFFRLQIDLAKSYKLPIVIHTRNSVDDAVDMIKNGHSKDLSGQFHCFSGNELQLNEILSLDNFYLSYCGNITYKNFIETEVIKKTPLDRMLSETDSPFLPPVPYRGKKNEPGYLVKTLEKIAELKETNIDMILPVISSNVGKVFFGNS
jgi:TatD DNase family protein